ncbi:MAG: hypothetical protein FWF29_07865, partial [Treponema sp.]|nr:hypothetical protein [Treponema sp.]
MKKWWKKTVLFLLLPLGFFSCQMFNRPNVTIQKSYQLTVSNTITNGTITVKDNIKTATANTPITLIIAPDPFFELDTLVYTIDNKPYSIRRSYNEETQTCTFTMPDGNTEVSGTFERLIRRIYTNVTPPQGGTLTTVPADTTIPGDLVSVELAANDGYRLTKDSDKAFANFFSLSDDGSVNWLSPPADSFFMPDSNVTVTAMFERVYSVQIFTANDDIATITLRDEDGVAATEFRAGEKVSVSINIHDMYWALNTLQSNWNTLGANGDGEVSNGFIMPEGNVLLFATYVPNPNNLYTVTVPDGISDGLITPVTDQGVYRPRAYADETIYLNIQPSPGFGVTDLKATNDYTDEDISLTQSTDASSYSFTMPARPVTINGAFAPRDLSITAAADPPEGGSISFPGRSSPYTAKMGNTVLVTPVPAANYRIKTGGVFYTYTDERGAASSITLASPYTIQPMPAYDITVNAQFERVYKVSKNIDASQGSLTVVRSGGTETDEFAVGEVVLVYVNLVDGINFTIDTVSITSSGTTYAITDRFTMPRNDVTVNVTFKPATVYRIRPDAGMINGSVQPVAADGSSLPEAPVGGRVYLAIRPNAGYDLDTVQYQVNTDTPVPISTAGYPTTPLSFIVPYLSNPSDAVTIIATFKRIDLKLTGTADPAAGGTVTFPGKGTTPVAQVGDTVTVGITPATSPKYRLKNNGVSYTYNSQTSQLSAPYTFIMPAYPTTVTAQFEQVYQVSTNIAAADASKGTLTIALQGGSETSEFAAGDIVRVYPVVTDNNYIVDTIRVTGSLNQVITDRFTMPAGNVTVTLTFKLNPDNVYRVAVDSTTNGSVTPETANGSYVSEAAVNDTVYLNIRPAAGYDLTKSSLSYR